MKNLNTSTEATHTTEPAIAVEPVLGTVDYSKITLCPSLNYECYCQIAGHCEYCPHFHTNEGENCKGCGANFKNKLLNTKIRFNYE